MMLHEIKAGIGATGKPRKRIGRGESSGWGKTAGRGHKGAGQRAGRMHTARHEGGRMPYFRRIPKRGFNNARFRIEFQIVNLADLEERFDAGQQVDGKALAQVRLIHEPDGLVKILGAGKLTKALTIKANKFSESAAEAIKAAGGSCELIA